MPKLDEKPLWQCEKCGRHFANRKQQHSCVKSAEGDFLKNRTKREVDLYKALVKEIKTIGPILLAPSKTRVGFQVRMIFAAANKLSNGHLDAHVVLARRLDNPRFRKIETVSPKNHVHHFRISQIADIDDEVRDWLREAYSVGRQEHLRRGEH